MRKKNRVSLLLINNGYPSSENPQYSTYVRSIEECLYDAGTEVDLLVLDTSFKGTISKYLNYLKFFWRLSLFNYQPYDYIYINNYPYFFLPLMLRIRRFNNLIIHWHGTDIMAQSRSKRILNKISYKFLPKTHFAIAPSKYFAAKVVDKIGSRRLNNIFVSPSGGVDIDKFSIQPKKKTNTIILGYASSLTTAKGADLIMRLGARLPSLRDCCNVDLNLKVIAYGAERDYYVSQLKLNKTVIVVNPLSKNKMNLFYNSIDVFLFPTKRKAESLGLVGLEAMSCGKPVVGTNDFALKEYIIPGETGELFEIDDYDDFEKAIIRTIKNLKNYKPRALVVDKYSKGAVVKQYKKIFNAFNQ